MILSFQPNSEKQLLATLAWQNDLVDDVVFGGGAGGGKSVWECSMLTLDAMRWPDTRYFIGRKELKNLMATTYITLTQEVFTRMGLVRDYHWKFNGQQSIVYLRQSPQHKWSTISLLDLKHDPSDPLFDRFGSHPYTRGAIEEASEIAFRAFDVLRSRTGRYRNKELGIKGKMGLTLNPSEDWPYRIFYDPWKKAGRPLDIEKPITWMKGEVDGEVVERRFVFIPVLAHENPDIGRDYRVNLATISDPVLKARLEKGDWEFSDAGDILFGAQGIADLYTNTAAYSDDKFMTVDAARFGGDKITRFFWRGWNLYKIKWQVRKKTTDTAELIRNDLKAEGIPRENCLIDQDGVGGGIVDQVDGCIGFSGGSAPFGKVGEMQVKEDFLNLRSQCVYYASDMVQARKASCTEQDLQVREWLAEELPKFKRRDAGKEGKKKITKKEDIAAALGRSPDFADAFWMRSYFDLREKEPKLNRGGGVATVYIPDV
jgi:phage terminase large subunit